LLLVCLVTLALSSVPSRFNVHTEVEKNFASWMKEHGKQYTTTEEHTMRLSNFKASLSRVASKNGKSNVTYAINKFSGLINYRNLSC